MNDAVITISAAVQSAISEDLNSTQWQPLCSAIPFPPKTDEDTIGKTTITVFAKGVQVPLSNDGDYALRIAIGSPKSQKYKRGWCFEGFVITKS